MRISKRRNFLNFSLFPFGKDLFEKKGFETGVSEKEKNVRHRRFGSKVLTDDVVFVKSE